MRTGREAQNEARREGRCEGGAKVSRRAKMPATDDGISSGFLVERLFARLQNFRRIVVLNARDATNFLGIVQLACILILFNPYL